MAVLALAFWSVTALAGLFLLAIWLIEYDPDFQHAAASRLPALVITGHVLFAVAGLVSWVIYLITGKEIYSWASAGALAAIATLGFTMVIRWIGVYRAWQRAATPVGPVPYAYGAYTLSAWAAMRAWTTRTPGSPDQAMPWQLAVPPERHFPVPAVIAHGVLAVTTVVLVLLTVLGLGRRLASVLARNIAARRALSPAAGREHRHCFAALVGDVGGSGLRVHRDTNREAADGDGGGYGIRAAADHPTP